MLQESPDQYLSMMKLYIYSYLTQALTKLLEKYNVSV